VGAEAAKLIAKAAARVSTRHQITGSDVPAFSDEFVREVRLEAWVMLVERTARNHRKIRKAARRIGRDAELAEAFWPPPVPPAGSELADLDPAWFAAAVAGELPPGEPGPPSWHPEHRLNPENL
jgi:hypothetical protein